MSKAVIQPFEEYQKARVMFVQTVAELANRPQNVDSLKKLGVIKLLGPLLSDPVTSIKQSAALAIGRLAKHDDELAKSVVNEDRGKILSQLLESLESNNKFYKKAACFVISSVARHSEDLAVKVVQGGAIRFLVSCLEEYDPSVKESAAWALGYIARHSKELATEIVNAKAIDFLILCLQEPEINIKRVAIQTLSNIARHSETLSKSVADKDNLNIILYYLVLKDTALKRQILLCLGNLAHHSSDVAYSIINGINIQHLEECITGKDVTCQKNALVLLDEIAKKRSELASITSTKMKLEVFIRFIEDHPGEPRLFGIPIISTLASYEKVQAESIIKLDGHKALALTIYTEKNEKILSLACLALSNLSKHNADLTNQIATDLFITGKDKHERVYNVPYKLLELCVDINSSPELKGTSYQALENIIKFCSFIPALVPLLDKPNFHGVDEDIFEKILVEVIRKLKELLVDNKQYKKEFIKNKTLKKIIELKKYYKSIKDELHAFSEFYPQEIINYFSEDYEQQIKEKYLNSNG